MRVCVGGGIKAFYCLKLILNTVIVMFYPAE